MNHIADWNSMQANTIDDDMRDRDELSEAGRQIGNLAQDFADLANAPELAQRVLTEYPVGARFLFSGRSLRNTDFSGHNLSGVDFRGSDLSGCRFDDALIYGADFTLACVSRDALKRARDWNDHARDERRSSLPPRAAFTRLPGERFSLSPRLPEVTVLDPALADRMAPDGDDTARQEIAYLTAGRLAIAITPFSGVEMADLLGGSRAETGRQWGAMNGHQARRLLDRLNDSGVLPQGWVAALPSADLFEAILKDRPRPAAGVALGTTVVQHSALCLGRPGAHGPQPEDVAASDADRLQAIGFATRASHRMGAPDRAPVAAAWLRPVFLIPPTGSL